MERAFGEDFGNVTIEQSRRATAATAALGTIAATAGNRICVSADFFRHRPEFCRRVLAHELAHVVQKRRFDPAISSMALDRRYRGLIEAEAHVAADHAVRGERAKVALSDAPAILAAWGPAGHYYTTYFVMLAAGIDADKAKTRAFFCQLPDQVFEFDAVAATLDAIDYKGFETTAAIGAWKTGAKYSTPSHGVEGYPGQKPNPELHWESHTVMRPAGRVMIKTVVQGWYHSTPARRMEIDREVMMGLHGLTGGWAQTETAFREQMLKEAHDDLEFGLALHPYGDSFAHRQISNPNFMYKASHLGHGPDGHEPDNIAARGGKNGMYLTYVERLYNLCKTGRPVLTFPETLKALSILDRVKEEIKDHDPDGKDLVACKMLIALAAGTRKNISIRGDYAPEHEDEVYWRQFWPRKPNNQIIGQFGTPDTVFERIRECGHKWYTKR